MATGIYILLDEDFDDPIYADPSPEELDPEVWTKVCDLVSEGVEADADVCASAEAGSLGITVRTLVRWGLSFVVVTPPEIKRKSADAYLKDLARRYLDEADDPRAPERAGVEDVVVDVIPPWEEDE